MDIDREVAALERMTVTELRRKYEDVFHEACRSHHKQWLIKRIAWRLQANAEGDLSERARQRAFEIANDADLRMKAPPKKRSSESPQPKRVTGPIASTHDPRIPLPGTMLTREYKGRELTVTVLSEGFEHEGETYKSLTAVAKAITGSHTSGFLFFGLNKKGCAK